MLAAMLWGDNWACKRILIFCDNEGIVLAINSGTSRSPLMAQLLRHLILSCMKGNFVFRAKHLPGVNNPIADALSRSQVLRFRGLALEACPKPTPIPPELLVTLRP